MQLADYLKTLTSDQRILVAKKAGTTREYLVQLAGGHRKASALLAKRLEDATGGKVAKSELRPDIFGPAASPQPEQAAKNKRGICGALTRTEDGKTKDIA